MIKYNVTSVEGSKYQAIISPDRTDLYIEFIEVYSGEHISLEPVDEINDYDNGVKFIDSAFDKECIVDDFDMLAIELYDENHIVVAVTDGMYFETDSIQAL